LSPIRAQKSNPIVTTGLLIYCIDPIVQALAPYPRQVAVRSTGLSLAHS